MQKRDSTTPASSSSATTTQPSITQPVGQPMQSSTQSTAPREPEGSGVPDAAAHSPRLGPDLQALIGQQLRAVYHEVLNEPVPDRFVRLLQELATKEAGCP